MKWKGTPLKQWGAGYRSQVAAVMQDDVLFAGSLEENITLFDTFIDTNRMLECAHVACIHEEIMAMTMGYQSLVGDMGSSLSGGQKQRVLLARALYRQPQLLVLDESTSHLDTALEERINENIKALHITRIAVAHRPHTLELADRVVYI